MDSKIKERVKAVLTEYLVANKCRKTPERYAILDAIYDQRGQFTLEELNENLLAQNFRVSRATLYNTIRLLISLRLVVKHILPTGTYYVAGYNNGAHVHQVCTTCGKSKEISIPAVTEAVGNARLKRFRREGFVLYVYGICSPCQAKLTRRHRTKS